MNNLARISLLAGALLGGAVRAAPEHGPAWLDAHGPQTIQWLKDQNFKTLAQLRTNPNFAIFQREAADILTDPRRLAPVTFIGDHVYQYWQTRDSPFGVWRRTL